MVIPSKEDTLGRAQFCTLSRAIKGTKQLCALAIMQLSHPGRQSSNVIGGRPLFCPPLAPSPVRVGSGKLVINGVDALSFLLHALLFQTPREMSLQDIDNVMAQFVRGACIAREAGFDGVQLHCAHGYLLSEFLSPKTNQRRDDYSCESPKNALQLLRRIVLGIRAAMGRTNFAIGVKIGAGDYSSARDTTNEALTPSERIAVTYVSEIASWGEVDFIEISGGDYEKPDFMTASSSRQPFYARVSRAIHAVLNEQCNETLRPLIILTGNIASPRAIEQVLIGDETSGACADLCGIGRMAILCPQLPLELDRELRQVHRLSDDDWRRTSFHPMPDLTPRSPLFSWVPKIGLVGAGSSMAWYNVRMRALAEGAEPNDAMGPIEAVLWMWLWLTMDDVRNLEGWIRRKAFWVLSILLIVGFLKLSIA
ncbi:hypothetical protein HDZ31DRAFT_62575 [Schizophyllum fasciatum]